MDIEYPSKGFLRQAIPALRNGTGLTIHVRDGWRAKILKRELRTLPTCEAETQSVNQSGKMFPSFVMAVFMISFSTVHFYALSGGYKMRSEDEFGLKVYYEQQA